MFRFLTKNPFGYLTAKTWRYAGERRSLFLWNFLWMTLAKIPDLGYPLITGLMINFFQKNGISLETFQYLIWFAIAIISAVLLFWSIHGPARTAERNTAFVVRKNYRAKLLQGVLDLPIAWHSAHHSGDTIDRVNKGAEALFRFSGRIYRVISALMGLFVASLVLIYFHAAIGIFMIFGGVVAVVFVMYVDARLVPQHRILNRNENNVSEAVFDVLSNVMTVVTLRIERIAQKSIIAEMLKPYKTYKSNVLLNEVKWGGVHLWTQIISMAIVLFYAYISLRAGQEVLIGTLIIILGYLERVERSVYTFTEIYSDLVVQKTSVQNAEELAEQFIDVEEVPQEMPKNWSTLTMTNLSFAYEDKEQLLQNVSLALARGEKIAFIGESGSGKSTLLKIMRGLYDIDTGSVAIDGTELSQGFHSMRDAMALIPQEPELFATTVRDNITLGLETKKATLAKYMEMARFADVAERLPKGLDSSIHEKGVNLSGGEKQRLALVRGLLFSEGKDIVLLDESTSSVDAINERAIYENIFSDFEDKTIIGVLHRLHLLELFDHVYMFDGGSIIAEGSFQELQESSKAFQKLWQKYQSEIA